MADCKTCANYTDFNEVDNGCYMCCKGLENNYQPIQTNADKIRSMTDAELADFLYGIDFYDDDGESIIKLGGVTIDDSKEDILGWLQEKVGD
jgi:hypothetical protein